MLERNISVASVGKRVICIFFVSVVFCCNAAFGMSEDVRNGVKRDHIPIIKKDYLMLVFSEPLKGKEAEYIKWYDHSHMPEIVAVEGVVKARRYESQLVPSKLKMTPPRKYMVQYTLKTTDIEETFKSFPVPVKTSSPPLVDRKNTVVVVFEALGPVVYGKGPKASNVSFAQTYQFIAVDEAKAGSEKAFRDWYENHHLADMSSTPGFISAQQYIKSPIQRGKTGKMAKYLTVYTLETDDINAVFSLLKARAAKFTKTKAVDYSTARHFVYRAVSPEIRAHP